MRLGVDGQAQVGLADLAEQRVDLAEAFDLIAPQFDSISVVFVGGEDFDDVAADAEGAAGEVVVVAFVEDFHQARDDLLAGDFLAFFQHEQHSVIRFGRAEAVDAAHAGDDDAIAAFEQRARGGEAQLVELVVDGGFFFDVDVAGRQVSFRLVVVVVADEIFDRVIGEEGAELVVELGG